MSFHRGGFYYSSIDTVEVIGEKYEEFDEDGWVHYTATSSSPNDEAGMMGTWIVNAERTVDVQAWLMGSVQWPKLLKRLVFCSPNETNRMFQQPNVMFRRLFW